eukprot:12298051-Alexandrium_andersonii.AAC.1
MWADAYRPLDIEAQPQGSRAHRSAEPAVCCAPRSGARRGPGELRALLCSAAHHLRPAPDDQAG